MRHGQPLLPVAVAKPEACVLFFAFSYARLFRMNYSWVNVSGGGSFSAFVVGNFLLAFLKGRVYGKKRLLFIYTTLSKAEMYSPADERMQVVTHPEINIQKTQFMKTQKNKEIHLPPHYVIIDIFTHVISSKHCNQNIILLV